MIRLAHMPQVACTEATGSASKPRIRRTGESRVGPGATLRRRRPDPCRQLRVPTRGQLTEVDLRGQSAWNGRMQILVCRATAADASTLADLRWSWRVDERGERACDSAGFVAAFTEWVRDHLDTH